MKRQIFIIAILLVGGAVVNVMVAWVCAIFVRPLGGAIEVGLEMNQQLSLELARDRRAGVDVILMNRGWICEPRDLAAWRRFELPQPEEIAPSWVDLKPTSEFEAMVASLPAESVTERRRLHAHGWPMPTLWHEWYNVWADDGDRVAWGGGGFVRTGLTPTPDMPRVLPLRPIWPAFLANTLSYVGVLWLLICAPRIARRTVRARRGRCIACGYPLGERGTCTECGRLTATRRSRSSRAGAIGAGTLATHGR